MGYESMRTRDDLHWAVNDLVDDEPDQLNVVEMIVVLRAIEHNLSDDPCLMDLVPDVIGLRAELEKRRELASQVADEIDAANCIAPH